MVAPGLTTRSDRMLLGAPGIATRSILTTVLVTRSYHEVAMPCPALAAVDPLINDHPTNQLCQP